MPAYAALDVSKTTTTIHIVDDAGTRLWHGKAPTCPDAIAAALAPFAGDLIRVGLETGCWTTWLWHGLRDRGLPAVCMDARQAKAALSLKINKTDGLRRAGPGPPAPDEAVPRGAGEELERDEGASPRPRPARGAAHPARPRGRHPRDLAHLRLDAEDHGRGAGLRGAGARAPRRAARSGPHRASDAGDVARRAAPGLPA